MMTKEFIEKKQKETAEFTKAHGIVLTPEEESHIEICDYELGDYDQIGTAIVIYVNTDRCCAKEMILSPWQLCPEHYHPAIGDNPGKEETFRCRFGEVFLYVPGEPAEHPLGKIPQERSAAFTVWHEIHLLPGEQYTMHPNTKHWFQAGSEGAIISEFSTHSVDKMDVFTDKDITRLSNLDD